MGTPRQERPRRPGSRAPPRAPGSGVAGPPPLPEQDGPPRRHRSYAVSELDLVAERGQRVPLTYLLDGPEAEVVVEARVLRGQRVLELERDDLRGAPPVDPVRQRHVHQPDGRMPL